MCSFIMQTIYCYNYVYSTGYIFIPYSYWSFVYYKLILQFLTCNSISFISNFIYLFSIYLYLFIIYIFRYCFYNQILTTTISFYF